MFNLAGRVALVTGGTRGLGGAIARGLAAAGANVTAVARSAGDAESRDGANPVKFLPMDLLDRAARAGLVDEITRREGRLDIFVHAAGQQFRADSVDFPARAWDELMELHVNAAMDLSRQAGGHMLPRGSGKVILVSSIVGFQGGLRVPAYAAAKHAMLGLVKALCNEWAGRGVNVNALAPGYFDTGLGKDVLHDPVRGPKILERIPAGRAGRPDELAGAAVFLASDAASFVHGHALVVDGGWLAR